MRDIPTTTASCIVLAFAAVSLVTCIVKATTHCSDFYNYRHRVDNHTQWPHEVPMPNHPSLTKAIVYGILSVIGTVAAAFVFADVMRALGAGA